MLDILEMISIAGSFAFLFVRGKEIKQRVREKKWVIVGFFCILLGSLVSAYHPDGLQAQELGRVKSWIVLPFLFVFLGYLCQFSFRKALVWYAISAGIVSLLSFFLPIAMAFTYDNRLRGWYESPNQLAMYIAPALVLLWFLSRERKNIRNIFLLGVLTLAPALVFTQSLGALLSVCSAIILGEWILFNFCHSDQRVREEWRNPSFYLSRKRAMGSWVIVFGILFFTVSALFFVQKEFFENRVSSDRSSFSSRTMIWTSALHIARDNPILGIGPGNFQGKYLEYQSFYPPYLEWAVPHPHNIFLTFWLFSGILGLVGFLVVVGSVMLRFILGCRSQITLCHSREGGNPEREENVIREYDATPKNKKTANIFVVAVFCALLSILLHGLVDTTIWGNALSVVFWLMILPITCRC
jgi:O-antigen ligase